MKKVIMKGILIVITVMMCITQLSNGILIYAQTNTMFNIELNDRDIYSKKIEVHQIEDNITKIGLQIDGKRLETKEVSDTLSFDVYTNGTYEIIGYDAKGAKISEESIKVDSFEDLTIEEDTTTHEVKIISRYHLTEKIKINDKEIIQAIETNPGVYEAYYKVTKNGDYTFTVLNFDENIVASQTKKFTDISTVNEEGKIVLSSEDDMKQIIANPSATFVLDANITMTSDFLKDVNFTGKLEGNGYIINGITERLFNGINNASISNVVIEGRLAETSTNSTISDTGFYVVADDHDKDFAVIMNSENTIINNSFVLANAEGKTVSAFILKGTGIITNSYVSGYLSGDEIFGFGKDVDVKNSYITASLLGKERVLFSNGKREDCFYDAQINDLEDTEATPYYTKDMISGELKIEAFSESKGNYPEIKTIKDFKNQAKDVSALSVVSVKTNSNLSALEDKVETEEIDNIEWDRFDSEILAESNNRINRFALQEVQPVTLISVGESTNATSTQITYPTIAGTYYKIAKSNETAPSMPTSHSDAISSGWKIVYWTGSNKATKLSWNTEYTIYSTDLKTVTTDGTVKTKYGKNGGKITLTGTYDVGETMNATLSGVNATKGTFYWETATTLDAKDEQWNEVQSISIDNTQTSSAYIVKKEEDGKYLRVRFVADDTTGYKGTLTDTTETIVKKEIKSVTIENKTTIGDTYTLNDQLTANIDPTGKELDVNFTWHHEGSDESIATGRNYKIKASDVGKKLYVVAKSKADGELKGNVTSALTSQVKAIQCTQPTAKDTLTKISQDDLTVTLTMDIDRGLYRYGYKEAGTDDIISYPVLARNKTKTTVTGLKPSTTYYLYVQEVGENGYEDSNWSSDYIEVKTDNEHVKGDVIVSGNMIYEETLTASIINGSSSQTGKFIWYRLDADGNREAIPLSEGSTTYTLTKNDVHSKIEVVYKGTGNYSGEVSIITDAVAKKEKSAPDTNLSINGYDDTTMTVMLPINNDGEKYIIGISNTKDGVPIEQLNEKNEILTFGSGAIYTIQGLNRDTEYFLSIRYAENEIHQKSEWTTSDLSVLQRTTKKNFVGNIAFTYEVKTNELMQGQKIIATLKPDDSSFNYKGIWKWFSVDDSGKETEINNFEMTNNKQGTSYVVPDNEVVGTKYKVTFEANVGFAGSISSTSVGVSATIKAQYATPDPNKIIMEAINDTSFKVMMSEGEGKYRFWYKEADNNLWDSFVGFFNKTFNDSNDGYKAANLNGDTGKDVYSNVDVVIEGLKRNTKYIIRVQRVEDDKGTTSEFAYSTDATQAENQFITTKKTEIAGHVTIDGIIRYGETLTATYNEASYGSTGSGRDTEGLWQWYRGGSTIPGATSATYALSKSDIGQVISVKYAMPADHNFTGTVEAKTEVIKKALCENPKINDDGIKDKQNAQGNLVLEVSGNASQNEENIYYRLQKAGLEAPQFPTNDIQLANDWKKVSTTTIAIERDADNLLLEANGRYILYAIRTATDINEASAVLSWSHTVGTYQQAGSINISGDFVVGKTVTATMSNDSNNDQGTWKWYMSKEAYNGTTVTSMPSVNAAAAWTEITSGFSPTINSKNSSLNITEEMFGRYLKAEFIADEEKNYSGIIYSKQANFIKRVYRETISLTTTTKDGNKNPKVYANSVITGTINNYVEDGTLDREVIRFKIGDSTYITGNSISIQDGTFTYTMTNEEQYDGLNIVAEVSTPKIVELYVKDDLSPLSKTTLSSNAIAYGAGIPISTANDLYSFMLRSTGNPKTGHYILTSNIDASNLTAIGINNVVDLSTGIFDGDYHTIYGLKNYLFENVSGTDEENLAIVKNLVIVNSQLSFGSSAGVLCRGAGKAVFNRIMAIDSSITSGLRGGLVVGRATESVDLSEILSAGGSATSSANTNVFGNSAGAFMGAAEGKTVISDVSTISTTVHSTTNGAGVYLGGLIGYFNKVDQSATPSMDIKNSYIASNVTATNGNIGPVVGYKGNYDFQSSNVYYDSTRYLNAKNNGIGDGKKTTELTGTAMKTGFGSEKWVYNEGYYPRLKWLENNPIAILYTSTRGAFISVGNTTSSSDLYDGNISGPIQIPYQLQTADYTVKSTDPSILKVTDSGMIIPVGSVGQKATIEITYNESDPDIRNAKSTNTYEFTIKQQVQAMDEISIIDNATNNVLVDKPQMNQVLKVKANQGTSYQWYRRKSGSTQSTAILNATASTYTIKAADIGYEFSVLVKQAGYASTFSNYTAAATSIKPSAPNVSSITDSSIVLKPTNGVDGLKYEFGYLRADQNTDKAIVAQIVDKNGSVPINNLQRNKKYLFYVRVAAASDGSYEASEWSEASQTLLNKTTVSGSVLLGSGINNGSDLSIKIESINGQTGTWKLERMAADGTTKKADITQTSTENSFSYKLTADDVGYRIKAAYTGSGDFKGSVSEISGIVQREYLSKPNKPVEVGMTDASITLKMETAGTYDIGYAKSSTGTVQDIKYKVAGQTDITLTNLDRNQEYYIYARQSETTSSLASPWSDPIVIKTEKTVMSGNITTEGTLNVDETITLKAPVLEDLTGTWKLERQTASGNTTTISPSSYIVNGEKNTVQYSLDSKDAGATIKVTFTGTGDYKDSILLVTSSISNAKLGIDNMPKGLNVSSIKEYSMTVSASDGTDIYQYGYAKKDTTKITAEEATGNAGTFITLNGLTRNTEYDLYVRKAAKIGYDASEWIKLDTKTTEKSALTGTIEYVKIENGVEKPATIGIADIGVTYKVKYLKGTYDQDVDDTTSGTWQWYANDAAIEGATLDTYTIQPMEGDKEITVKYLAKAESDFKESRMVSIGTLTKPAYEAPSVLPIVTPLEEDGKSGSRLQITNRDVDHVFYYVQAESNAVIPTTVASSTVENNEVKVGQWFKATSDVTLNLKANTEYVVYLARLEDGEHRSSGVVSQRAVKTVKEDLDNSNNTLTITEVDDTNWKVLQDKELRISDNGKAIEGVWQYYVTTTPGADDTWANITSEIKGNTVEGKTEAYVYTKVNIPLKYTNGYFVRAVFTGRGDYEGSKTYTSTEALIGTQIQGHVEIGQGDTSKVFVPIEVNYIYAKNADGTEIKDEANGIWTWYRETEANSGTYEKIVREKDTVGTTDQYIPTAEDVEKKIYAVYSGAREGNYSGSVESGKLNNVQRSPQAVPSDISVKQVNGTSVQIVLPTNMHTQGKTIAQPRLEYTIKGVNDWQQNGIGEAWIYNLKANTEYNVRVFFEGTSEYKTSEYGTIITVKTGNQSFDEDNLTIVSPSKLKSGEKITATFTGNGYDEGYFVVKRSDGATIKNIESKVESTIKKRTLFTSGSNTMEYEVQSADIGSNIIIQYQAKEDATTFGGYIEKSTEEVSKPMNSTKAGTPILETTQYSETTLKVKVNDANEYVFNDSATAISETSSEWIKLKAENDGYYTFPGLDKTKNYYLHARTAETMYFSHSEEDVSAATKPWSSTTFAILYEGIEGATNGNPANPTQYTELSDEITLRDAIKSGYLFKGWTSNDVDEPTKGLTIPTHSSGIKTFTAHWEILNYNITYNLGGGKINGNNPIEYNVETDTFTLINPTRKGYTFVGWSGTGITGQLENVTIPKGSIEDRTYTANWNKITYDITYHLDGGTNAINNPLKYDVETNTFSLADPRKEGYTFAGWSGTDITGTSKIVTIEKGTTEKREYTANWTVIPYSITYHLDGGEVEITNKSEYTIETDNFTLLNPTKRGYTFLGWTEGNSTDKKETVTVTKGTTGNKEFTAHWEENTYVISYVLDGGIQNINNPSSYKITDEDIILKAPNKTGHTFEGWKLNGAGDLLPTVTIASGSIGNLSYTAIWKKVTYKVTFDSQGGSAVAETGADYQERIVKPNDPNKIGYTFNGWYKENTCRNVWSFDTDVVENNTTLYAKWTINEYTAIFNANEGESVTPETITKNYNEALGELPIATRNGYTFDGWFTNADDTGVKISKETTMPVDGATYYAHWIINQYTVKFDGNGGSDGADLTADYNSELGTLPKSSKTGYTFDGWYTDKTGGTKIDENTLMPLNGTTYYAHWIINQYTAKFDGNGGSNGSDIKVDYNAKLGALPTSTRKGYDFKGWFTEKTGGTMVDENTLMPLDGTTFYAQWTINQYTVKFDGNGGSDGSSIKKDFDEELGELPTSTRKGYDFKGWYTEKTGGDKILETTKMPADGATYYAQWTAKEYKIEYDLNDENTGNASNNPENKLIYTIEDGDILLKDPSWKLHVFIGWSYEGMTNPAIPEMNVIIPSGSTENKKYTANWRMSAHTVTFDSKGGSEVEEQGVDDSALLREPSMPIREGYTFEGWYTKNSVKWNFEKDKVIADITLYANWTINQYTVTFDPNGGEGVSPESITKNYQEALGTLPTASRIGYTFLGWFTKADDTGKEITNVTKMPVNGAAYYAHWKVNSYTVSFNSNGGTSVDEITKNYGVKLGTLPKPTKEGYTFVGWFTELENGVEITKDTLMPVDGATFYAHWILNKYTITFETNGGNPIKSIIVKHGDKLEILEEPRKDMFIFTGWYTDKELKNRYNMEDGIVKDIILYAKYEVAVPGKAEIVIDKDSPIKLRNEQDEIIEAVLNEKEYRDYLYGKDVSIRIECKAVNEYEHNIVNAALNGRTIAKNYDITIYKTIDNVEFKVDKLRKVIRIVLDIPVELLSKNGVLRVFDVIRIHEDTSELLHDLDKDEKTVTIESDEFSIYVLCYKDSNEEHIDTSVLAPLEKSEGIAKNPTANLPSNSSKDEDITSKNENDNFNNSNKEEQEKNADDYFLIALVGVFALCIGLLILLKKKKSYKELDNK